MKRKHTRRLLGVLLAMLLFAGSLILPSAAAGTVTVNDANLRSALAAALGTDSITDDNMKSLTTLDLSGKNISDLTGLEAAVNLTQLSLRGNSVTDITPLAGLTQLTVLDLAGNRISSVTSLTSMSSLRVLHLTGNEVSSLVPLETLQKLQFLFCEDNRLDLSAGSPAAGSVDTLSFRGCYVVTGVQKSVPDPGDSSSSAPPVSSDPVVTDAKITVRPGSSAKIDRTANFLSGIAQNTPVTSVQTLLDGSGCTLRVLDASGTAASGNFGTGMKVQLINSVGTLLDELTVVVYGDINGNGSIDIGDLVLVNQHVLKLRTLEGAYFEAGNAAKKVNNNSSDTTVDIGDLVIINQCVLKLRTLEQ
ncbi:MAG: leucine-rich repeat domain-containing protein [Firmicutes bacterium]|nr:leucine-rich repeat domain-containing protein [Bacillota bacterium]